MKKKYRIKSKFRFTLFMVMFMLLSISAVGTVSGNYTSESLTKVQYSEIEVQAGDTLWEIAKEFGPEDKEVREMVYEICELNNISADTIYPGKVIIIPRYI